MKRIVACILSMTVLFGIVGCQKAKVTTKTSEITTLSWIVPISNQPDAKSVMDEIAKITEPAIGARVDLQFIDASSFKERMTMNMASGLAYDLAFVGYVNPYFTAVNNGGLLELDSLIEKEAPKLKVALPDYAWEIAKISGKVYAVPNLQVFAPSNSLFIFKDLAEKYNFDLTNIKKMSDLEPYLEKLKAGEPNIYPYRPYYTTLMWTGGIYEEISSGVAIRCDGSSPDVFFIYETPEYKEGLDSLNKWYKKGYIRQDLLSVGSDEQDMKAGRYAISQSGWTPGAETIAKANNGGRDVAIIPMMTPYLSKEKGIATMVGIGINSKNPEKSIKLIELMNTNKELYNLISYGIEGKHYTLNSEKKVVPLKDSGYYHNQGWVFGNQFNARVLEGQDDKIWEETEKLNANAVKSPILGFVLDTNPIRNEISQISAVQSEFSGGMAFISNGVGHWNEYIKKLDEAGRQKVLKEIQKQVTKWWNANK